MESTKVMTTYDKCKHIRNLLLNASGIINLNTAWLNWWNDSCPEPFNQVLNEYIPKLEEVSGCSFAIDPNDLTLQEMEDLNFLPWKPPGLQLVPIWLFRFLDKSAKGISMDSGEIKQVSDWDLIVIHHFSYGCYPKDHRKE